MAAEYFEDFRRFLLRDSLNLARRPTLLWPDQVDFIAQCGFRSDPSLKVGAVPAIAAGGGESYLSNIRRLLFSAA